MRDTLPAFRKVKRSYAASFIHNVLSSGRGAALQQLIAYDDNHFRAVFRSTYFVLNAGQRVPSKSQWNTLKKKIKRRNRSAFVFREYGETDCGGQGANEAGETCFYLDFGFLLD